MQVDPKSNVKRHVGRRPGKEGVHTKLEVQSTGMRPEAKERLEPPEAGGDKEESPLEPSEGVRPSQHLALGLPASRARGNIVLLFKATWFVGMSYNSGGKPVGK